MTAVEKKECNKQRKSNSLYVYNNRTMRCRKRCISEKRRKPTKASCVLKCKYPNARTCKRSAVKKSSSMLF